MSAKLNPLPIDLARLPKLPLEELRSLWHEHFGRSRSPQRRLMVRELAYRVQEQRVGGMDAATRRLLAAAVRAASNGGSGGANGGESKISESQCGTSAATAPAKRRSPRVVAPPQLPAAATLKRVWHGRTYEVTVVEHGKAFRYQGKTYASLTEVAREITGTHWSGPRFFGLARGQGSRPKKEARA